MTWHKYTDPETLKVPDEIPLDRGFPAIDDDDKFCFVWCIGDLEHGGSAYNWEYVYRRGIVRQSTYLKIKAWFEIPIYEGTLF